MKQWLAWVGAIAVVGTLGFLMIRSAMQTSEVSADLQAIAEENAGGPVKVHTGSQHTVYHGTAPLPTEANPRSDGKASLIWFSGTWCSFCRQMEPFAHQVANEYTDQFAFVEKSVDHDRRAAARYGVRATPTFVFISETGKQLDRFSFVQDASSFRSKLDALAAQTDASMSSQ